MPIVYTNLWERQIRVYSGWFKQFSRKDFEFLPFLCKFKMVYFWVPYLFIQNYETDIRFATKLFIQLVLTQNLHNRTNSLLSDLPTDASVLSFLYFLSKNLKLQLIYQPVTYSCSKKFKHCWKSGTIFGANFIAWKKFKNTFLLIYDAVPESDT